MTMIIVFVVLLGYSGLTWLWVGRDPREGQLISRSIPPLEPAADSRPMSASAVDFVRQRGRLRAKGLSAAFYGLHKRGLLEIAQGQGEIFRISLKEAADGLQHAYPEEHGLYKTLTRTLKFPASLVLDSEQAAFARKLNGVVKSSLRRQYRNLWRSNLVFAVICYLLTVVALALGLAVGQGQENLRYGMLLAAGGLGLASGLVFGLYALVMDRYANRKTLGIALIAAAGLAFALIAGSFLGKMTWLEFAAFILILVLPPVYALLIKAPSGQYRIIMDQLAGYATFLTNLGAEGNPAQDHTAYLLVLDKEQGWLGDFAGQLELCLRYRGKPEQKIVPVKPE